MGASPPAFHSMTIRPRDVWACGTQNTDQPCHGYLVLRALLRERSSDYLSAPRGPDRQTRQAHRVACAADHDLGVHAHVSPRTAVKLEFDSLMRWVMIQVAVESCCACGLFFVERYCLL